jgi:DNA primase large subunit
MDYKPSQKELSHFPFLKKAQDHIKSRFSTLDSLLKDAKGEDLINRATLRVQDSMAAARKISHPEVTGSVDDEIASYALARIIVSCVHDKQLIDRLTRYEAEPELQDGGCGIFTVVHRAGGRNGNPDHP